MNYLEAGAVISDCGLYRYTLTRRWAESAERVATVVFCMLNPSTADGAQDDPTIRRCVSFAKAWGFAGLIVVNLFALRATRPSDLPKARDPIGPENNFYTTAMIAGRTVVCAWGATVAKSPRITLCERVGDVKKLLRQDPEQSIRHLGLIQAGHPRHPLYLPVGTELQSF